MKACVIGDSHAAMLVGGAKLLDRPDLEITTFAQAGDGPEDVSFEGSVITAQGRKLKRFLDRMGTPHSLDLGRFDLLILVSRTANAYNMFKILKGYRVSDWASTQTSAFLRKLVDPLEELGEGRLITGAAMQACLISLIQTNLTYQLCTHIRRSTQVPIFIVPTPLLAENSLQRRPRFFGLKRALNRADGDDLRACLERAHLAAFAGLSDVEVIAQPPQSIVQGCLTKEAYGRDSVRLASSQQHDNTDIMHAGPKLGKLIFEEILRRHPAKIAL